MARTPVASPSTRVAPGSCSGLADGKPGEQLGTGVESAGDVDGDGVQDVIAGAPYSGRAYVYSGKDGHVLFTLKAENDSDAFGQHVSSAGDVDHDGHADFLVGAPANNAGGRGAGRAYLYSGKDGHLLLDAHGRARRRCVRHLRRRLRDSARTFIVIGAPSAGSGKVGRTYVYRGALAEAEVHHRIRLHRASARRRCSSRWLGDVNGDGVPDIYASDFTNGAKGPSTGRIYVHSGRDGKRLLTLTGENRRRGIRHRARQRRAMSITMATRISSSARGSTPERQRQGGRVYLFSGRDGRLLKTYTDRVPGDTFGFDAVGIGDVDGDGDRGLSAHRGVERRARQSLGANLHRVERSEVVAGYPLPQPRSMAPAPHAIRNSPMPINVYAS